MPRTKLSIEKIKLQRIWTSVDEETIANIETQMIIEDRTFAAMVRKLILDALQERSNPGTTVKPIPG